MAQFKNLLHKKSNVVVDGSPKLPTKDDIEYGELAINYAKDHETISLKNSEEEIVTFSSDKVLEAFRTETNNKFTKLKVTTGERTNDDLEYVADATDKILSAATSYSHADTLLSANIQRLLKAITAIYANGWAGTKAEYLALENIDPYKLYMIIDLENEVNQIENLPTGDYEINGVWHGTQNGYDELVEAGEIVDDVIYVVQSPIDLITLTSKIDKMYYGTHRIYELKQGNKESFEPYLDVEPLEQMFSSSQSDGDEYVFSNTDWTVEIGDEN